MSHVRVGAVDTWYDVQGEGEPLLLLHGGFTDSRTFEPAVPLFTKQFRVYTVDRRGHGRTADSDAPFSYEAMAEETIAFLEQVVGGPAHLVGYSDGANTALLVALRRPDLVRKLVSVSGNFHHDGLIPGTLDFGDEVISHFAPNYGAVSPDGEDHFPVVFRKGLEMATTQPELDADELGAITARTLVLASDDDMMTLEHTVELYRAIPDSELAIVPGTSHTLLFEKPKQAYGTIIDFLTSDPVPTRVPVRRAR
ncbi:alpha/beta fold hydrolase [Nocardia pseudobrasiliensis]|uniref:Pimeloyl-ACP methyl ester carboxylesterase n=1 Tax=Nocardia pseudobrasiliensis TaxID=45979 RepID=A0A370HTU2_9NOCA|nr:alpha/beta hydrolase [Nocardia pseudobrasiliensis]RDI61710.1 pimeloyl-ACP methyl ester carboxylesterase [Nocardia pseudobrasiliensis]